MHVECLGPPQSIESFAADDAKIHKDKIFGVYECDLYISFLQQCDKLKTLVWSFVDELAGEAMVEMRMRAMHRDLDSPKCSSVPKLVKAAISWKGSRHHPLAGFEHEQVDGNVERTLRGMVNYEDALILQENEDAVFNGVGRVSDHILHRVSTSVRLVSGLYPE